MFGFGKKDEVKKESNGGKKETDVKNIRIDVEDMIDQGYTCEEIATELKIDKDRVYGIKEARKRREARLENPTSSKPEPEEDPIKKIKTEMAELQLQQQKMELEWKIEDRKRQREDELAGGDDEDDIIDTVVDEVADKNTPENAFLNAVAPHLIAKFFGGAQTPPQPPYVQGHVVTPPPAATATAPAEPQPTPLTQEVQAVAAQGVLTEEEVVVNVEKIKGMIPKKYNLFIPTMKNELRKFTDVDIIRMKNKFLEG